MVADRSRSGRTPRGNTVLPLGFTDHITLSAEIWIAITLGAEACRPAASLLLRGP